MACRLHILRKLLGPVLLLAIVLGCVRAIPAAADEPTAKAIDAAVLLQFPAKPHSGFSVAIVHAGRVVYEKGFGFRDDGTPDRFIPKDQNYYGMPFARAKATRAPTDGRTIYELGSVTKQFTAAALLRLAEQRRLSIDDPVQRYAPEFRDPSLTLRMLLNQRSGLPDLNTLAFMQRVRPLAKRADGSLDEQRISREIAALPPNFAPGARYEYSNSNYFIVGTLVERVTHETLATFLSRTFFGPLGMTRTGYGRPAAVDDVAVAYRLDEKSDVLRAYPWDLDWLGGAGALTSSVDDLARWNLALLDHRALQPASLADMWHGLDAGRGQGSYAMGWIEDALGTHRYLWHNGQVGGFHALNVIFPGDDLAFSILCNNQDARPEFLVPGIASLYFPIGGIDRILPRSGVVLIEASLAVAIGALAIAIVAIVTFKRFIVAGVLVAVLAFIVGFLVPTILGFVWAGIAALVPTALYVVAVRVIPRRPARAVAQKR